MQLTPRIYQEEAISPVIQVFNQYRQALMVMATGLGKTLTSAWVVKKVNKFPGLFLAHNNDILKKTIEDYRLVFPTLKFGVFNGKEKDAWGVDIVFASVQTMQRNLHLFSPRRFKWLILDESHHAPAKTFKKVIQYFNCPKLGVTATPNRMDLQDIRQLFGSEVVDVPVEQAIARGWLPPIEYHLMADSSLNETYLKEIAKQVIENGERISIERIKKRLFVKTREKKIASIIEGYKEKVIVFCKNIVRANEFHKLLKDSAIYHSGQDAEKNSQAIKNLRSGLIRYICAVNAFNEGIDVPDVGLVVFARSTQSETVFRQQLGRGLRPGKKKLIVLDFAGNIERIRMIHRIVTKIDEIQREDDIICHDDTGYRNNSFVVSGKGFKFTFSKQIVDIIEVLDHLEADFYPTWQEASKAAIQLECVSGPNYKKKYKRDPKLPACPHISYPDFPGWGLFLNSAFVEKYPTYAEASKAAIELGIKKSVDYHKRYKEDPRLPSQPRQTYKDFFGWKRFLQTEPYPTWQEAAEAARSLNIKTQREYTRDCKRNPRLPAAPWSYYKDFPGLKIFIYGKKWTKYSTWQKAAKATKKLKMRNGTEYFRKYREDPGLPATPYKFYPDFPGWEVFFGGTKRLPPYETVAQAQAAVRRLGFKTCIEYDRDYKKDSRLRRSPHVVYHNFPGWPAFLRGKSS